MLKILQFTAMDVVVTGASGRLGRLVVKNLLAAGHKVRAFVRKRETWERAATEAGIEEFDDDTNKLDTLMRHLNKINGKSTKKLSMQSKPKGKLWVVEGDILGESELRKRSSISDSRHLISAAYQNEGGRRARNSNSNSSANIALDTVMSGANALIICTSCQPKVHPTYNAHGNHFDGSGYQFPEGGMPEQVDYHGILNTVEAARRAGSIQRVILISTMGTRCRTTKAAKKSKAANKKLNIHKNTNTL